MDELSPQEMEKLILGYEELEPADQAVADRVLQRHPQLAARLKWHQGLEARSATPLSVQVEPIELSEEESRAQQDSLRRILSDLEQKMASSDAKVISPGNRLWRQTLWALPLAAILALAILLPRETQEKLLMQNLSVSQVELLSDGTRGPGHAVPRDSELRTGEAFALDFYLNDDAYVVVYHVDPRGQVSRVYPASITDDLVPLRGGQSHRIPGPESEETWILGNDTGIESFLVAAHPDWPTVLDNVEPAPALATRETILADLQTQLKAVASQVDLYEFHHVD